MSEERKVGVYICGGCGIADAVDTAQMEKVATGEFKVPLCKQHDFLCGDEGVAMIAADVKAGEVTHPVIAACSPRVMTDKFRFDGTEVVRGNLREQVVWCHTANDEDTQMMADDVIRMGVAQAKKVTAPKAAPEEEFSETVLVVGGGYVGMTAAIEASKSGHKAILVERSDRLGGMAGRWSKVMPHMPPYREPQDNPVPALVAAVEADANVTVMTDTIVAKTAGMPGQFDVELSKAGTVTAERVGAIVVATGWRPYDATKLGHLGYGASPDVVTNVELEDLLGDGPVKRKSDGNPVKTVAFVQCAGSRDPAHLPYCSSVCCGVSMKHAVQMIDADPDVMAYVIFDELRTPGVAEEFYRAAQEKGVIFVKGKVASVGGDLTVTYHDELLGDDIPMAGLDMVVLATGMVPNSTNTEAPTAELEEEQLVMLHDDINPVSPIPVAGYKDGVEAPEPPARPAEVLPEGAPVLNLQYRQGPHIPILADGFSDSHYICFPYETRRTGIYTCGPVRRPMDMGEAGQDAAGAVLKAIQAIRNVSQGRSVHPRSGDLSYPKFGLDICTKCRRCTVECPFGAIDERADDFPVLNAARCRRCGTCMGACPVRTISFDNYSVAMINDMAKAVEIPDEFDEKPRILILACQNDAYPALDMAGINRHQYSAYVRTIPVRCLGSVSMLNASEALSTGYDGVILMGCKSGDDYQCHFVKGSGLAEERMGKIEETLKSMMLEKERVTTMQVSIADSAAVAKLINEFAETIDTIGLNPFKGF
ncbi:MAG: FAD-dependent oxidoreductase [Hyphomicrobiales bacterium]|nr:FAD-dependent oxidoreductase [Hyphomicrobiales bacterium]